MNTDTPITKTSAIKGKNTPGPWKLWHSGSTAAPYVIYAGVDIPKLDRAGRLVMGSSTYIGEISSQAMRLDEHDNIVDEGLANARLVISACGVSL
jgi:hypothetical protein